jgi:hypothetical protein
LKEQLGLCALFPTGLRGFARNLAPPFLAKLRSPRLRSFARTLNSLFWSQSFGTGFPTLPSAKPSKSHRRRVFLSRHDFENILSLPLTQET